MSTISTTEWRRLSGMVNNIDRPARFLQDLLFPASTRVFSLQEHIEVGVVEAEREMAPFVKKNGEAIAVGGVGETSFVVEPPNIRIKKPTNPRSYTQFRMPGVTPEHVSGSGAAEMRMAARMREQWDTEFLMGLIENREEWLIAMLLRGKIEYSNGTYDNFTLDQNRPAETTIDIGADLYWDQTDKSLPRPLTNILTAKRVASDLFDSQPTDMILGRNASAAFQELAESGNLKALKTDSGISAGSVNMRARFSETGAILLGDLGSVRIWEYPRKLKDHQTGVTYDLIRPDYAEFIFPASATIPSMYYGAIQDIQAMRGGVPMSMRRFAKSWEIQDPSGRVYLAQSRPLPMFARRKAAISMKVTNGS